MRAPPAAGPWLVAVTLLAASLIPSVAGHGLLTLNVQVPPQAECPDGGARCLAPVEPQPPLHAGDHVDLLVWNDDDEPHRILVAENASADPDHGDTPAGAAIAGIEVPANASREGGSFTVPDGAEALYVWCDEPGHEAAGAWMRVPVEAPSDATNRIPIGPGGLILGLAAALWAMTGRRP